MDIVAAGSTITRLFNNDQLSRVRLELSADATEVGTGSCVLPDPDSDDAIAGGRQFMVSEGATVLSDGFVGVQVRERGPLPVHPSVEATYTVYDANALLHGTRMVNWSRPAETDQARILARAAIDLPGVDTSFVLGTNLVTMEAKNYTTVGWDELMRDVAEYAGKTVFLHDLADGTGRCLHSHKETEGHVCGLEITDDLTVADGVTVFLAEMSPNRNRSAQQLVNDVYARDQAGRTALADDAGSITAHDADGLKHQAIVDFQATSQADLQAKADSYIVEMADEVDIYSATIGPLDEDALALIRVGDRIDVDSQTLDFTGTIRIAHMSLSPRVVDGLVKWDADLELGQAIRLRSKITSGVGKVTVGRVAGPDILGAVLGTENFTDAEHQSYISHKWDSGGEVAHEAFLSGEVTPPVGFNSHDTPNPGTHAIIGRYFLGHDAPVGATHARLRCDVIAERLEDLMLPESPLKIYHGSWGAATFPDFTDIVAATPILQDVVLVARWTAAMGGGEAYRRYPIDINIPIKSFNDGRVQFVIGAGADNTFDSPGLPAYGWHRVFLVKSGADPATDTEYYELTFYGAHAAGELGAPVSFVATAVGDGLTTIFTTPYPYVPGSLVVTVDGVEQEVAETDSETGSFTLPYAPDEGAMIRTSFVIASLEQTSVPVPETGGELAPDVPAAGSNIQDVGSANSPGTGEDFASDNHVHEGVHSIRKAAATVLHGDVTLSEGTNVTLTQVGQDIAIASSGGGGGSGWEDVSTTGVKLETGRSDIWDASETNRIVLASGGIDVRTTGGEIWLLPDSGNVVTVDSGDGLILPRLAADPTAFDDGHVYYNTANDIIRLRANGAWVDVGGAGGSTWTTIVKLADEARVSDATVTDDSDLVVALAANTQYALRLMAFFQTNATADLKYRIVFTGDADRLRRRIRRTATTDVAQTIELKTAVDGADVVLSTTGLNPWLEEDIIIQVGASGGNLALQWAQVTSNGGATTCLEGSYIEWAEA